MRRIEVDLGAESALVALDVDGTRTQQRRSYRGGGPWGLTRWIDPADGGAYVLFSGALGGAVDLLGEVTGPDDLMPTILTVRDASADAVTVAPSAGGVLAGHHLGFASGPFATTSGSGVVLQRRRSSEVDTGGVLAETRAVLDWMLDFFGGAAPWGSDYVQVLVPQAPWLAMEHPGCVLLSERLLSADRARRFAVLAHEAAHQWVGNLVSPATWADVGVFEGLAEALGQWACSDLLGTAAEPYLAQRRRLSQLAAIPGRDPHNDALTAGLAEVAGPVAHAELYRSLRDSLPAGAFRDRVRGLVGSQKGIATSAAKVWATFGVERREPARVPLPTATYVEGGPWLREIRTLGTDDPATALLRARRAFRAAEPAGGRVGEALSALCDTTVSGAVAVALAAELVTAFEGGRVWHDPKPQKGHTV